MEIPFVNPQNQNTLSKELEGLRDEKTQAFFPFKKGAYRFVSAENYTDNFGFQWNQFTKTQIDRESEQVSQSSTRFFKVTAWDKEDLKGKNILEVGSGAGRFSQVILDETQANLYSVDYSSAVEANFENNGHHQGRFYLAQASIYELPFPNNSFDKVFCFGVLQHTPDVKKSVQSLIEMARVGGEVIVDFYPIRGWWTKLHAKYIFRPFTKSMNHQKLLKSIQKNASWLIALYQFLYKIKLGVLTRFLPICDIRNTLPPNLSKEELKEWVILDTFDMFSPEYDQPQKLSTVKKWFEELGLQKVEAKFVEIATGNSVATVRGIKV